MDTFILIDPASSNDKRTDFTSIWIIRFDKGNYYCIPVKLMLKKLTSMMGILLVNHNEPRG